MHHTDPHCIFCKIVAGEIPSKKVYEDDELFAFHDINPWAPVHFLIVPKAHIVSMAHVGPEHEALLGRIMALAPRLPRPPAEARKRRRAGLSRAAHTSCHQGAGAGRE